LNPGKEQDEIFYEKNTFEGFLGKQARYVFSSFLIHEDKEIIQTIGYG
jgi:hypothetical protein